MSRFVDYPVATPDVRDLTAAQLTQLQTQTGAPVNEAAPLVAAVEGVMLRIAETRTMMVDISRAAFRDSGLKIDGVARIEAAAATIATTWTMVDDAGYTIPPGTRVAYRLAGDRLVQFELPDPLTIAPGNDVATDVTVRAITPGTHANGLTPAVLILVDPLAAIASVTATATSTGGEDAETDLDYVERLARFRRRRGDKLILPEDFADAALEHPAVARALAIANYDPDTGATDAERHVSTVLVQADGTPVADPDKAEVEATFAARRELGFIGHAIDAAYTAVHVDFDATAHTGHDPLVVRAAGIAALTAAISPASHGTGGVQGQWLPVTTLYPFELGGVLDRVEGLNEIRSVTINGGVLPVVLPGIGPLPAPTDDPDDPSTVTGTVT